MELIVDDRERAVIKYFDEVLKVKVDRITVGDYAFAYNGKVLVTVERKSLSDLASSIKDGRMDNNIKLLDAQKKHGCKILYIIEGPAYPSLNRKFSRMPYKCLQGKLDSLLFRHDIKIIWTKNAEHTAKRLTGLFKKLTKMVNEGVFGDICGAGEKEDPNKIIKAKHTVSLDQVLLKMLTKIPNMSYKSAMASIKKYSPIQLMTGQIDEQVCYNLHYVSSGFKLGPRGTKIYSSCKNLHNLPHIHSKIISCISGITEQTATLMLNEITFHDIILLKFKEGQIANIRKTSKRKIGNAIEKRIRLTFS